MSTATEQETERKFTLVSSVTADQGPQEQGIAIRKLLDSHYPGVTVHFDHPPKDDKHARDNAAGWLESIREMVGKLTRKGAAEIFAEEQNREQVIAFLDEFDCPVEPERWDGESDTELREFLDDAIRDGGFEPEGFEFNEEATRETIQESVLSVEVRSDWYTPGTDADDDSRKPSEFCILLSTGGPALRLIGELDENGQPTRAWLEYQDWGTPWTHYYVEGAGEVLLEFAGVFYFGE